MKKITFILSALIFFLSANGETRESSHTNRDSLAVTLDEINVTALKQMNVLKNQPEAYTVLGASEIEQLGIVTMRGVSDVVPNFYMPDYGSKITSSIYVRGIGARMDQPSVGLNVDNIPYLNKDAYDFDISDISSVVMLRGPQSTLYGRNTMAGVINITTLSPMRYQGWRVFAEAGNGGRIKGAIGWYHKFSRKTALSITADYSHLNGFFTNEYNGEKTDKENSFGSRIKFQWHPSEKIKLRNTLSAGLLRQSGYPYEYLKAGVISYDDTCFYRRFTLADGLTLSYAGDKFRLSSITSLQYINDNMTLDQDFLPVDYFTLTQKKQETSFTEEIVVKSIDVSANYQWMNGLFGFYKHLSMQAPVVFKDMGISELIEKHRNDANPTYPIKWDSREFPLNSEFTIPTFGFAAYHESSLNLGNWHLTAGIRVDYEKSTLDYHSFCDTGYEILHVTSENTELYRKVDIKIDDNGKLSKHFVTILPKITALYDFPGTRNNIYLKVTRGYKAGGFNTQMFSDVLQQRLMGIMGLGADYDTGEIVSYKPEQSWNYEIGSHLDFFNSKLGAELAAFYIDCRDQQLTVFPDGTTTGRMMTNAGKTRSFGCEISFEMNPVSNWMFNASYGYTNARFRKFFNGITDYKGKFLPYVPSNTLFLQTLYVVNLSEKNKSSLTFDVNMRGTGKIFWNEENDIRQNFYVLLGASATLKYRNLEFKLWGRNLSDTKYYTFYFMSMGNEFAQRGRGLEAGLSIRWHM